jgi:hypothetical protein
VTEKQIERVKTKIRRIRATLAAEKRKYGDYDDSRGIRFYPPRLYLEIGDLKGALTYLRWFDKNFPGGGFYPDFLFEWTLILFKTGKLKEAEKKAFETFCSNTYLFDKFLGREIMQIDKFEGSNLETTEFANYMKYLSSQVELKDFSLWLENYIATDKFQKLSTTYIEIYKKLKTEKDRETRGNLIDQVAQLRKEF